MYGILISISYRTYQIYVALRVCSPKPSWFFPKYHLRTGDISKERLFLPPFKNTYHNWRNILKNKIIAMTIVTKILEKFTTIDWFTEPALQEVLKVLFICFLATVAHICRNIGSYLICWHKRVLSRTFTKKIKWWGEIGIQILLKIHKIIQNNGPPGIFTL